MRVFKSPACPRSTCCFLLGALLSGILATSPAHSSGPDREPPTGAELQAQDPLPEDVFWREGFHLPSLDAPVLGFVVHEGNLIAGGQFRLAGAATSTHIASWDGSRWSSLGLGMNNWVSALAVFRGELYAGGSFTKADAKIVNHIAKWDGTSWVPVGEGMDEAVWTLQVYGDRLYAGGLFVNAGGLQVNHVASWDGEAWSDAGGGVNNGVFDLEVFDGTLFACGAFDQAGGEPASYIAAWDGSSWHSAGAALNFWANSMTVYGESLVVGGDFTFSGDLQVNHMAMFDGSGWRAMGSGTNGGVIDVDVVDNELVAVGPFSLAGEVNSIGIAKWNGASWETISSSQLNERGTAIAAYDGRLVVSGYFTSSNHGETDLDFIATLDQADWFPMMDRSALGPNGPVYSLARYGDDVIVGGNFDRVGMMETNSVARWDGSRWHSMSGGVRGSVQTINVLDVNVGVGDRDKTLYIGGVFNIADGQTANSIAYWDGANWQPIGDGFSLAGQGGSVFDIEEFRGKLYAAGLFSNSGGLPLDSVARWDGRQWRDIDNIEISGILRDLHVYKDELLLAGSFTTELDGQPWGQLIRWTGHGWLPFQEEKGRFGRPVYSMLTLGEDLVVGGEFSSVGVKRVDKVTRWDGYAWKTMGSGFRDAVHVLAMHQGSLIAGGRFPRSGSTFTQRIARWSGSDWEPLGSGLDGAEPEASALTSGVNSLFVGGIFSTAGNHASRNFAEWTGMFTPVELTSFHVQRTGASAILTWTLAGDPANHIGFHVYRGKEAARVRLSRQLLRGGLEYTFEDTAPPPGRVEYWLADLSRSGDVTWHGPVVLGPADALTPVLALAQNNPNPFRGSTRIAYEIPVEGRVRISVFDVSGREVSRLLDRSVPAGRGEVFWNGKTSSGKTAPSGVYFYRLQTERGERIKRLTLTR